MFCFAHIINNIVHAICEHEQVRSIVNKIASLVKYVKSSGINQNLRKIGCKSLKSYIVTRWNTVYLMIDSVLKCYNQLFKVLQEKEDFDVTGKTKCVHRLTNWSMSKARDIVGFLKKIHTLTTNIEGEKNYDSSGLAIV